MAGGERRRSGEHERRGGEGEPLLESHVHGGRSSRLKQAWLRGRSSSAPTQPIVYNITSPEPRSPANPSRGTFGGTKRLLLLAGDTTRKGSGNEGSNASCSLTAVQPRCKEVYELIAYVRTLDVPVVNLSSAARCAHHTKVNLLQPCCSYNRY